MRHGHLWFESVLIAITIFMGLGTLITSQTPSSEFGFLAAMWLIALGVLQVFHSFFIGANYWENPGVRQSISLYWGGVALNFIVMFINNISVNLEVLSMGTILIFPCFLALCLWYITFKFRLQVNHVVEQ